ncbi:MAG: DUF4982 domain-containing protein [Rikenellaceae bacterium]|nr:DUF4982 domain-containing protein [Rikenellaceae bacterium]
MKKLLTALLTALFWLPALAGGHGLPRIHENFDFDWRFRLGELPGADAPALDDGEWRTLHLPHDFSIEQPFEQQMGGSMGYLPGGVGWYRKSFDVPADYRGRKISILFDGVYHRSDVYVNGRHIGFYPYGYIGFEYDLSPYLNYGGGNVIAVRVDHSDAASSRWYSGSGIYRSVWLTVTDPVRVQTWGTYITTPEVSMEMATVNIVTTLENNGNGRKNVTLENIILNHNGERINSSSVAVSLPKGSNTDVEQRLAIPDPILWDLDNPYRYTMRTLVVSDGEVVDSYESPFGVRWFEFDPDRGFFLNGRHIKMKGMNLHEDAGALGVAVPYRANERKMQILKEFGCNAIRFSHNPPSPDMLELCDRLGFLAIDEAFDKWKSGYYSEYYDRWWQTDLGSMIRRDRNHPCIVLWSIGNETVEQNDTGGEGTRMAETMRDFVHGLEPTRPVMAAIASANVAQMPYLKNGFAESLDVVGFNYMEPWLDRIHEENPDWVIFGSEVMPFYYGRDDSVRDYFPYNPWNDYARKDYLFGYFIWAGVDYIGESSGWPSKGWPTGPFATTMREKPRAAYLRSEWNDAPMVRITVADQSLPIDPGKDHWSWPHLADHWTFPQYTGHIIQVQTITNCEEVELNVGGIWTGRRRTEDYANNTIVWYVPYPHDWQDGRITARGFIAGREVASYELCRAGDAVRMDIVPDRSEIRADGKDLVYINVELKDNAGVVVPVQDRTVHFEMSGPGRIMGVDSGDLRSCESYKGDSHTTYFGFVQAIVQSEREAGEITVTVRADGLPDNSVRITSR